MVQKVAVNVTLFRFPVEWARSGGLGMRQKFVQWSTLRYKLLLQSNKPPHKDLSSCACLWYFGWQCNAGKLLLSRRKVSLRHGLALYLHNLGTQYNLPWTKAQYQSSIIWRSQMWFQKLHFDIRLKSKGVIMQFTKRYLCIQEVQLCIYSLLNTVNYNNPILCTMELCNRFFSCLTPFFYCSVSLEENGRSRLLFQKTKVVAKSIFKNFLIK